MSCADLDNLLCDYLDGALEGARRTADLETVQRHLAGCAACRDQVEDARAAKAFLARVEPVEPPRELVTRILFQVPAGKAADSGSGRRWRAWFTGWLGPVLQPRFAMGMAMTILSFSMLGKFAGLPQRQLTPADLHPAKVWSALEDNAHRAVDRAVKYYENLRLVYEIQSRLKQWTDQEESERQAQAAGAGTAPGQSSGSGIETRTPGER